MTRLIAGGPVASAPVDRTDPTAVTPVQAVRSPSALQRVRRVRNRHIFPRVALGVARTLARRDQTTHQLLKSVWIELKRYSAPRVINLDISEIAGLERPMVTGGVSRYCRLVLSALSTLLQCRTAFEIGTFRGETAWTLAHNNPGLQVYTLDLPALEWATKTRLELTDRNEYFRSWERGAQFMATPEADRITQLYGDSASFDFSPFEGRMDLVFIDGSHSFSYVKSDTEAAFRLLSDRGTIVWDDYTYYPGIYLYLNELATAFEGSIVHLLGTRLALYTRTEILQTPQLTDP